MRLIDPPDGRPWALLVLCGVSLCVNVLFLARELSADRPPAEEPIALDEAAAIPVAEAATEQADGTGSIVVEGLGEEPAPEPVPEGVRVVRAGVTHSLARSFVAAVPEHADVVSAVYARLFCWDLDLRRDLQKGDGIAVAYEWDGELAHIHVATYDSKKLGRPLHAYYFHATGDTFPSYWDEEGQEVGRRLKQGPLDEYEQVTSLLRDRPNHKGMDFKVPTGAEVVAPQSGTVVRVNWNLAYNGNCVEMRYADGTTAKFLHLSATDVRAGQRLAAGEHIGLSGNTGRSTAPHVHYELERGGRILDPVEYHGLVRRTLPAGDLEAFRAEVARLDRILATET
ncbi:MAG: M23 family metallopeptidase [Deltaproteobacteria bacterium]|nr:M23 family metallopeptidase [Deltaproteobacteria bacterium]MBW2253741.1 M23 family metallopeptidase [Deltaproteobacteria bacterium]